MPVIHREIDDKVIMYINKQLKSCVHASLEASKVGGTYDE